jgi:hypothetical protein
MLCEEAVMRIVPTLVALTLGVACAQTTSQPALSEAQIRDLFAQVADQDLKNDRMADDYTYTEREEQHILDGKGRAKKTEAKTFDVMELYGSELRRLVARDDKPLSGEEAAKEADRIRKWTAQHAGESDQQRARREERREKSREENRQFVREVSDAYNFTLVDNVSLDGRETYVIDGVPRPGYQPHLKEAQILPKFRFRAWIDKQDREWKKLDIQCIDTVSFGWVLARLHKGSRIMIEQTRVNDEVWLPQHIAVRVDARVALLKEFNLDQDLTYRDYKKFRADSRIVTAGEVTAPQD